jgi:hypothetical protein
LWPTLGRTEGRANCAEAAIAVVADGNGDGADERGARGLAADGKGISKICAFLDYSTNEMLRLNVHTITRTRATARSVK